MPIAQTFFWRKFTLLNTKIIKRQKNFFFFLITVIVILVFDFLNFCLAVSIPSLSGILVYKERRPKETK